MPIQLVRHGKYNQQGLTEEGKLHSVSARDILVAKGLGRGATILCSSALRAVQTAEIIATEIGDGTVHPSDLIQEVANYPEAVRDLDVVLQKAVQDSGLPEIPDDLVVVAHMPLLGFVEYGDSYAEFGYGAVVEYELGTWQNPEYDL